VIQPTVELLAPCGRALTRPGPASGPHLHQAAAVAAAAAEMGAWGASEERGAPQVGWVGRLDFAGSVMVDGMYNLLLLLLELPAAAGGGQVAAPLLQVLAALCEVPAPGPAAVVPQLQCQHPRCRPGPAASAGCSVPHVESTGSHLWAQHGARNLAAAVVG
jgi:hypothetical protein